MIFMNLTNKTDIMNLRIQEPVLIYAKYMELGIHKVDLA